MGSRLTIEFCKEESKKFGYDILSSKYVNNKKNLKFLHIQCGEKFKMRWSDFYNHGQRCPFCCRKWITIEFCREEAEKRGYTLLTKRYISDREFSMRFIHNLCGHEFRMRWNSFNIRGQGCPKCAGTMRLTLKYCKKEVIAKGFKILDKKYTNSTTRMKFLHLECGRVSKITWDGFRRGQKCSFCSASNGEMEVMRVLKLMKFEINKDFFLEKCFSDLKYIQLLYFDFYIPEKNLLIEYQGFQHFFPVDFAGKGKKWAKEQFKINKKKDEMKRQYCYKNNLYLLEIKYDENVEDILKKYLL